MSVRTLTKQLAGIRDILWGRGDASQTRNGTDYTIERVAKIHPVDLLVDIKALATIDPDNQYFEVIMKGTAGINDGNGGSFYFAAASTAIPDDLTVIKPDDINVANPGRWLKLVEVGVARTGDTMTGQLEGITPVGVADFTRKDYVDAQFLNHLDGLDAAGLSNPYTSDLDTININSRYPASTSVATNFPAAIGVGRLIIIDTVMTSIADSANSRIQTVRVTDNTTANELWVRETTTGDGGWSAWTNTFVGNLTGNVTGNVNGDLTGNADTVTTNANLSGDVTSSGNVTTIAANSVDHAMLALGYMGGAYIRLEDQQTSGTSGGTPTAGSWQTRVLNTEENDSEGQCTLSSNQFILEAGTYRIRACSGYANAGSFQTRLYNVTGAAAILNSLNGYDNATVAYDQVNNSLLSGEFTVAASQSLRLEYRVGTANANGLGLANSFGTERYAIVELWKLSD